MGEWLKPHDCKSCSNDTLVRIQLCPPNKGSEPKGKTIYAVAPTQHEYWGISSFGRAAALQAVGDQFDPDILHQDMGS